MPSSNDQVLDIHGKKYNRWLMFILLLIGTFAGMLMQTSLGTAIPTLMKAFDINLSTAQQATTWFLLANGIVVPLSAYLMTRTSTKWLLFTAYALLLGGMTITYLTPEDSNYWIMFLGGRILAAIAVGITMPLMQVIAVNVFPENKRALALGLGGLVVGMAPAIGPTLSGWILDKDHVIFGINIVSSWRTIFIIPMIVITLVLLLTPFVMKDVIPNKKIKLDILSLVLSSIGFGLFLWGFTNVAMDGWSSMNSVILPIIAGTIFIILFVLRQLRLKEPFLDVRVFKVRNFTVTALIIILVTMAMYGVEMMLPTYLQNVHGLSPLDSGLTLLAGALMMGLISPIAGILYNKVGVRNLALVGLTILAIGTIPFVFLSATTPTIFITVLYAIRMAGIALTMMPLTTSAMNALPIEETTHGTAANNTVRQLASSVVVALLTSITQNIINTNSPAKAMKDTNPMEFASKTIDASMDGFRVSFAVGLGFAVVGLIITIFFLRAKKDNTGGAK
ncbi:multidrug transporter [Floricoccus penangensis]|uniref:Multidrug transporter n=1 Tax=Floricoccus penangensis TaxID=1859475 RepID=A0A9Q5NYJ2_9LACT|nr:MDR family MFS transporter [Floricoccus penangensis]OFI45706.1 multidrug transporter [Floricoccus penangensis]